MTELMGIIDGPKWYMQTWWPSDSLSSRQESLLRILAVSQRESLEVVPLLICLAEEHRGSYRRILQLLAQRIQAGHSLVVALEQTPDALRDEDVLALRLASQSGTWQATFQDLLSNRVADAEAIRSPSKGTWFYWTWLSIVLLLILTFIMNIVVPTFLKMSEEFGLGLPNGFRQLARTFSGNIGWVLLLVIFLTVWFSFFRAPRRYFERKLAPRLSRQVTQRQVVALLRMLALSVESGKPLAGALSTLARYHHDSSLRNRLLFARNEVEQGVEPWQSLGKVGLLSAQEVTALTEAPTNEIRAWALRQLASQKLLVASRKVATYVALIEPAITLLFGAVVLWICFSLFSFLTSMISSLS